MCHYNVHIWEIGLKDRDCGTVSKQNYDNLTSPSDNSVEHKSRIYSADGFGA